VNLVIHFKTGITTEARKTTEHALQRILHFENYAVFQTTLEGRGHLIP